MQVACVTLMPHSVLCGALYVSRRSGVTESIAIVKNHVICQIADFRVSAAVTLSKVTMRGISQAHFVHFVRSPEDE